jgi:hypothetical protein
VARYPRFYAHSSTDCHLPQADPKVIGDGHKDLVWLGSWMPPSRLVGGGLWVISIKPLDALISAV